MFNANHIYFEFTPPNGVTFVNWGVGFRIQFEKHRHDEIVNWLQAMVDHFKGQPEEPEAIDPSATSDLIETEFAGQKIMVPGNARRALPPAPTSKPIPTEAQAEEVWTTKQANPRISQPDPQTAQAELNRIARIPTKAPIVHVPFVKPTPKAVSRPSTMPFPPKGTVPELPPPVVQEGTHPESPLPFPASGLACCRGLLVRRRVRAIAARADCLRRERHADA